MRRSSHKDCTCVKAVNVSGGDASQQAGLVHEARPKPTSFRQGRLDELLDEYSLTLEALSQQLVYTCINTLGVGKIERLITHLCSHKLPFDLQSPFAAQVPVPLPAPNPPMPPRLRVPIAIPSRARAGPFPSPPSTRRAYSSISVGDGKSHVVDLAFQRHDPPPDETSHSPRRRSPIIIMHGLFGSQRNNRTMSK